MLMFLTLAFQLKRGKEGMRDSEATILGGWINLFEKGRSNIESIIQMIINLMIAYNRSLLQMNRAACLAGCPRTRRLELVIKYLILNRLSRF